MRSRTPLLYEGGMPTIHVRIDVASDELLTAKADATGLTRSAHVQLALNQYLRPTRPTEAIAPRRVGKKR